ncbi:MAG: cytochrome c biogenesis protein [Archaeoglobaceae archaeon]
MRTALLAHVAGLALLAYGCYKAFTLPPVGGNIAENYRIVFFHVPAAISAFTAFTVTFTFSAAFLARNNYRFDVFAESSARFGMAMITAALISGSVWAKVAWGSYWNWDPRETFVLVLWFAYAAYFALRASIEDYEVKARYSAIYAILAFVTVPISYLSSILFPSLHPTTAELRFDAARGMTLGVMITSFLLIYVSYLLLDAKLRIVESKFGGVLLE